MKIDASQLQDEGINVQQYMDTLDERYNEWERRFNAEFMRLTGGTPAYDWNTRWAFEQGLDPKEEAREYFESLQDDSWIM